MWRSHGPENQPQEKRQGEDVEDGSNAEMLKEAGPRMLPPASHAHQPGKQKPEREMTTVQGMKFIAAGTERQHPDYRSKHAKHTRSRSINSLHQGNPQRASCGPVSGARPSEPV